MKRLLCIFLSVLMLLTLTGCSYGDMDGYRFYYRRRELQFGTEDGVIRAEARDIDGHKGDFSYLIALYFSGPLDEELVSPFHPSTRLLSVRQEEEHLIIQLTDSGIAIPDSEFSLACACLSFTCMENPGITAVTVENRHRTVTMTRDILTIYENIADSGSATEETK